MMPSVGFIFVQYALPIAGFEVPYLLAVLYFSNTDTCAESYSSGLRVYNGRDLKFCRASVGNRTNNVSLCRYTGSWLC